MPLHTKLPRAEARYILQDSSCRQALVHPQFRPALESDLRALGVEIVDLPPEWSGAAETDDEEEVEFVKGGPVRPSTDAIVIYTRCGLVCGMGKSRSAWSVDLLIDGLTCMRFPLPLAHDSVVRRGGPRAWSRRTRSWRP